MVGRSGSKAWGRIKQSEGSRSRVERTFSAASMAQFFFSSRAFRPAVFNIEIQGAEAPNLKSGLDAGLKARSTLALLLLLVLFVLPSAAQLTLGDNLSMNANGLISLGYNDAWGNSFESNHSLEVGGSGTVSGYYYNPNFLNFQVSPYYNRSQANSESQSIFNTSGIETSANIFSGSHFPGSVGYSKGWNSEGNFGLPGTPNYTTYGDGQSFNVGWGAYVPGLPSLLATYYKGSSEYTVLGTDQDDNNSYQNLGLRSNYTVAGFNLLAAYTLGNSHSFIPEVFGNQAESFTSNNDALQFGATHTLPMHGSASASFTRSYLDTNYLGYKFNGTIDTVKISLE